MATIPETHQLYLYRLFSAQAGTNTQTPLARMEEILTQDGILPEDLSCESIRELLESLEGFVRLTVFKRGRVYATILPQPSWDAILAQLDEKPADKQAQRGKRTWKKARGGKGLLPVKPRPKRRPKPLTDLAEQEPAPLEEEPAETQAAVPQPGEAKETDTIPQPKDAGQPKGTPQPEKAHEAELISPQPKDPEPTSSSPQPQDTEEPAGTTSSQDTDELSGGRTPAPPAPPTITLSVVYDPSEDGEDSEEQVTEPDSVAEVSSAEQAAPLLPRTPQDRLPQTIRNDVYYTYDQLALLYQIVPVDQDPLSLLDQDWHHARSTENLEHAGGCVSFNLQVYNPQTGEPLKATIRRDARNASGKSWSLVGLSGIPSDPADLGLDGLPAHDAGSWSSLTAFAHVGPEQELLEALARLAEPEPWGEDLLGLRTYLALAFKRAGREQGIHLSDDTLRAEFDTGLLSRRGLPIMMRFVAQDDDIRWLFVGFAETL